MIAESQVELVRIRDPQKTKPLVVKVATVGRNRSCTPEKPLHLLGHRHDNVALGEEVVGRVRTVVVLLFSGSPDSGVDGVNRDLVAIAG